MLTFICDNMHGCIIGAMACRKITGQYLNHLKKDSYYDLLILSKEIERPPVTVLT